MKNVKIKICGLSRYEDIAYVNKVQADYAGFVLFYPQSSRHVEAAKAEQLLECIDDKIKTVAVTVNPNMEQLRAVENAGFDILQVHGELEPEILEASSLPIFRALNIERPEACQNAERHDKIIGYVLDGKESGSGQTFDWHLISDFDRDGKLLILAGGLNEENVLQSIETVKPDIVDVSSGVEGHDGNKSGDKIIAFTESVKRKEYANGQESIR